MPIRGKRKPKINGRRIEKLLFDNLKKNNPKWWIYRYNEQKFKFTPADMLVQTARYDIQVEVKATGTNAIQRVNIRHSQIKGLIEWSKHRRTNISVIVMYFGLKKKFVFVDVATFVRKLKQSRITYEEAAKVGYVVENWKSVGIYFRNVLKR